MLQTSSNKTKILGVSQKKLTDKLSISIPKFPNRNQKKYFKLCDFNILSARYYIFLPCIRKSHIQ